MDAVCENGLNYKVQMGLWTLHCRSISNCRQCSL